MTHLLTIHTQVEGEITAIAFGGAGILRYHGFVIFVPFTAPHGKTLLDVIVSSKLPVVLVTRTSLGTINHTLLTIEALRARQVDVLGIVFNGDTGSSMEQDNIQTILQYHSLPYAIIPKLQNLSQLMDFAMTHTTLFERLFNYETSIN